MTLDLYVPGSSAVHRIPPGIKLVLLAGLGTLLFIFNSLVFVGLVLIATLLAYRAAGISMPLLLAQMRPVIWFLAILFLAQLWLAGWVMAAFIALRFFALILLASLITLTTKSSHMIETIERSLFGLRYVGINPAKIGLAVSLALRFIPVLATITREVREAQRVRGLEHSVVAVAVPVIVRTLKMANAIAEAMDARGYDPQIK